MGTYIVALAVPTPLASLATLRLCRVRDTTTELVADEGVLVLQWSGGIARAVDIVSAWMGWDCARSLPRRGIAVLIEERFQGRVVVVRARDREAFDCVIVKDARHASDDKAVVWNVVVRE